MATSDFRPEVEIWPFRACAMHPAIIIGTVRSLYRRDYGADATFHRTYFYSLVLKMLHRLRFSSFEF